MTARVLVIDDSTMTVQLIQEALAAAGIAADGASDLASLDERLKENTYGLVLVDVNMPEMYGDDVVEFLKVQRRLSARLMLYSDLTEDELKLKVESSGADGFIAKSHGLEAAVDEVRRALGVSAPTEARARRVLVVDDSEPTLKLLESELAARGHEVLTASTAEAATRIILKKKSRPDLVLLDVNMPGINGEELCRFIKSNSLFQGIQVVLCSSADEDDLKRIVATAGADGYVRKDTLIAREILELL